jgi:hypothetical protein
MYKTNVTDAQRSNIKQALELSPKIHQIKGMNKICFEQLIRNSLFLFKTDYAINRSK